MGRERGREVWVGREGGRCGRERGKEVWGGREREGGVGRERGREVWVGREGGEEEGSEERRRKGARKEGGQGGRKKQALAFSFFLFPIIFSRPLKAPEAMKRMFVVSTATNSPLTLRDRSENVTVTN